METLARAANRGSVPTGYDIDNSLKLEENNLECINTPNSYSLITASNVYKGTTSFWIKRTSLNNGSGVQWLFNGANSNRSDGLYWDPNDKLKGYFAALGNGADFVTTQVFRDTSAWYHIVMAIDTSHSTASERIKIYVNGEQITAWDTSPSIDQNTQLTHLGTDAYHGWGTSYSYNLGISTDGSSEYLANCIHIDGQQLTSTDFGEFDDNSGIWKPKAYTGTYGNKGYLLEFQSSSALGTDTSGNGNNFTNNRNITSADQATDTPTNNFCTLNVLNNKYLTITEGATKSVESTDSVWYGCTTTIGVNNGKWYSEGKAIAIGTGIFFGVTPFNGTADASIGMGSSVFPGNVADTMGYWNGGGGQVYRDNSVVATIGAFAANDIIGIALDMDNGYVYFAKNGTWLNSGNPTSGATGTGGFSLLNPTETHGFAFGLKNSTAGINLSGYKVYTPSSAASDANGYGTFEYAPPSGYYALCTKNLAEYG